MEYFNIEEMEKRTVVEGADGVFVHSGNMTFAYWDLAPGSVIPHHAHPHEQVVNMLEGELELVVDGETRRLTPGDVVVIPPEAAHQATAIVPTRVLDVFNPVREDYR